MQVHERTYSSLTYDHAILRSLPPKHTLRIYVNRFSIHGHNLRTTFIITWSKHSSLALFSSRACLDTIRSPWHGLLTFILFLFLCFSFWKSSKKEKILQKRWNFRLHSSSAWKFIKIFTFRGNKFSQFNFTLIQKIISVASLRMYETCYLIYLLILEQFKF